MTVTKEQAQMLAALAVASRPTGAPRWDEAGVVAALAKVKDRTLADVILATIRAADDREARTPGVIAAAGSVHWQERGQRPQQREPYDRTGTCSTCSLPHAKCRQVWADDHPYISVHDYAKTVHKDPERIRRIVESVKAEKTPMREPSTIRASKITEREHADCDDAIAAAIARGHKGEAEYLSTRCDREHGTTTDPEEVGTGAGEGATGQDTGTAWVTRSADYPEAPAQAHLLGTTTETDPEERTA